MRVGDFNGAMVEAIFLSFLYSFSTSGKTDDLLDTSYGFLSSNHIVVVSGPQI